MRDVAEPHATQVVLLRVPVEDRCSSIPRRRGPREEEVSVRCEVVLWDLKHECEVSRRSRSLGGVKRRKITGQTDGCLCIRRSGTACVTIFVFQLNDPTHCGFQLCERGFSCDRKTCSVFSYIHLLELFRQLPSRHMFDGRICVQVVLRPARVPLIT